MSLKPTNRVDEFGNNLIFEHPCEARFNWNKYKILSITKNQSMKRVGDIVIGKFYGDKLYLNAHTNEAHIIGAFELYSGPDNFMDYLISLNVDPEKLRIDYKKAYYELCAKSGLTQIIIQRFKNTDSIQSLLF